MFTSILLLGARNLDIPRNTKSFGTVYLYLNILYRHPPNPPRSTSFLAMAEINKFRNKLKLSISGRHEDEEGSTNCKTSLANNWKCLTSSQNCINLLQLKCCFNYLDRLCTSLSVFVDIPFQDNVTTGFAIQFFCSVSHLRNEERIIKILSALSNAQRSLQLQLELMSPCFQVKSFNSFKEKKKGCHPECSSTTQAF